jgi:hypothetical protein
VFTIFPVRKTAASISPLKPAGKSTLIVPEAIRMSAPAPRQLRAETIKLIEPAATVVETVPPLSVNAVSLSVALTRNAPSTPESFTLP